MQNIKYFFKILGVNYFIIPLILSLFIMAASVGSFEFHGWLYLAIIGGVFLVTHGLFYRRVFKKPLPNNFSARYLPVCLPLLVLLISWAVLLMLSGGSYRADVFFWFYLIELPFTPINFLTALLGNIDYVFYIPLIYNFVGLLVFSIFERFTKDNVKVVKSFVLGMSAVSIACLGVGSYFIVKRNERILPPNYNFDYGGGYASVDIYRYDVSNPNNILPMLNQPSSFVINHVKDMPVLDGAEAAYPVYSAFAKACYQDISKIMSDSDKKLDIIAFTNTIYAFERLVLGEVDIFFGAQPSQAQREMAEKAGKKLVLTPIGKEAFVFFVNKDNQLDSLTIEQIKDIYSGKVKNWRAINGKDHKIIAFQRPENSGSQTIMQKIMGDTALQTPLIEEYISGMGGVSEGVAAYRNSVGAIGYSFRFFTTGMASDADKIKLLAIDGVKASSENIIDNSYPFVVNLYAITLEDNPKKTIPLFLYWMQSEQGQQLIEDIGYLKIGG